MSKQYYVYIMANKRNGTLYVGVTSNLVKRVYEHKSKLVDGFSNKYGTDKLVYFEVLDNATEAIRREKQIKAWKRSWKLNHIEQLNASWKDLYEDII